MDMEAGKTLTNEEVIRELLELLRFDGQNHPVKRGLYLENFT